MENLFNILRTHGNYNGRWECHIKQDWLLVWKQVDVGKIIYLERITPTLIYFIKFFKFPYKKSS